MRKLVITVILAGILALVLAAPAFADPGHPGIQHWKDGCNNGGEQRWS